MVDAYYAVALQLHCRSVNGVEGRGDAQKVIDGAIEHVRGAINGALRFHGMDTKLVVLPEYFLTGHPMGEGLDEWRDKACIAADGPEYEALAKIAQEADIFLAGNAYETDTHFPELYFQTSFLIAPNGEQVLRYRRLISMYSPSPWDVWDKYLDIYGADAIFPVAETEIGRVGAIASEEILYPEIARLLAVRGAEVFLHSSSEVGSNELTIKNVAKRARAIENLAYVVSANSAGISGSMVLEASTEKGSQIVNYKGDVMVEAGYGESVIAFSEIDLAALRRYRRRPAMGNILARQPMDLYAQYYGNQIVQPGNGLMKEGEVAMPERTYFLKRQSEVIDRLAKDGVI